MSPAILEFPSCQPDWIGDALAVDFATHPTHHAFRKPGPPALRTTFAKRLCSNMRHLRRAAKRGHAAASKRGCGDALPTGPFMWGGGGLPPHPTPTCGEAAGLPPHMTTYVWGGGVVASPSAPYLWGGGGGASPRDVVRGVALPTPGPRPTHPSFSASLGESHYHVLNARLCLCLLSLPLLFNAAILVVTCAVRPPACAYDTPRATQHVCSVGLIIRLMHAHTCLQRKQVVSECQPVSAS